MKRKWKKHLLKCKPKPLKPSKRRIQKSVQFGSMYGNGSYSMGYKWIYTEEERMEIDTVEKFRANIGKNATFKLQGRTICGKLGGARSNTYVSLCQNEISGANKPNRFGYLYSWSIPATSGIIERYNIVLTEKGNKVETMTETKKELAREDYKNYVGSAVTFENNEKKLITGGVLYKSNVGSMYIIHNDSTADGSGFSEKLPKGYTYSWSIGHGISNYKVTLVDEMITAVPQKGAPVWFTGTPVLVEAWDESSKPSNPRKGFYITHVESNTYKEHILPLRDQEMSVQGIKEYLEAHSWYDLVSTIITPYSNISPLLEEEKVSCKVTITKNGVDSEIELTKEQIEQLGLNK